MSKIAFEYDLVVLTAGKGESEIIKALIEKRQSGLGIKAIRCAPPLIHPRRDPGCLHESPQVLQSFVRRSAYALVVFDWEGSGREETSPPDLEAEVTDALAEKGWKDRCSVVVIAPELESWIWAKSPHVSRTLGWGDDYDALTKTLADRGFVFSGGKPERPKEAVEASLREKRIQPSAALYAEIASKVSLSRCTDRSFQKLRSQLAEWFGAAS